MMQVSSFGGLDHQWIVRTTELGVLGNDDLQESVVVWRVLPRQRDVERKVEDPQAMKARIDSGLVHIPVGPFPTVRAESGSGVEHATTTQSISLSNSEVMREEGEHCIKRVTFHMGELVRVGAIHEWENDLRFVPRRKFPEALVLHSVGRIEHSCAVRKCEFGDLEPPRVDTDSGALQDCLIERRFHPRPFGFPRFKRGSGSASLATNVDTEAPLLNQYTDAPAGAQGVGHDRIEIERVW